MPPATPASPPSPRPAGAAPVAGSRDRVVDWLRGLAICFVVVDHLPVPSAYQVLTEEAIGPVSSAELFVALSGVVLGSVHARRVADSGWGASAQQMWSRAGTLYLTAVTLVVVTWLLTLVPGVDGRFVTTFTDQGTGAAGAEGAGQVYDLYGWFRGVADGTVPFPEAMEALFLLRMGPWQANILGLYVALLLLAPLVTWLLARRLWPVVVVLSLAGWGVALVEPVRVLPSQFEDAFPLLSWQVLFVLGTVVGWHRSAVLAAARTRAGRAVVVLLVVAWLAAVAFSWANPYLSNALDVRWVLLDDATYTQVYAEWFARTDLRPGRLAATWAFLVAAYALLTVAWRPVSAATSAALEPLGRATLYVFVVHVPVVLLVAQLGDRDTSLGVGTLLATATLALLWLMVRTRFLFGIVPR
ncbi:OpgC domain-containing protein [Nocardioides perillae]|uniref:OpgC protein n=1 Tax=Nocardioides perillae TaxID=1119534 RepID=A0A7Y9RU41_9ACTN|nr:hypothetical protein [Nocardioides perillae]